MPPDPPSGLSADQWAAYLERYDRELALKAESVRQGDEYNRLLAENTRVQEEAQRHQVRLHEYQKRTGKWALVVVGVLLAGLVGVAFLLEARKARREATPPTARG